MLKQNGIGSLFVSVVVLTTYTLPFQDCDGFQGSCPRHRLKKYKKREKLFNKFCSLKYPMTRVPR